MCSYKHDNYQIIILLLAIYTETHVSVCGVNEKAMELIEHSLLRALLISNMKIYVVLDLTKINYS